MLNIQRCYNIIIYRYKKSVKRMTDQMNLFSTEKNKIAVEANSDSKKIRSFLEL